MHDDRPHHLLAQLPLTVSPFLSLPTATTLPYTYKSLPSTLPPSCIDAPAPTSLPTSNTAPTSDQPHPPKPAYVVSSTGHAAHPDDIIASCQALQAHLRKMEEDARETVRRWEEGIRERELAEKRRVAPGWLDGEQRMLVPERKGGDVDTGGSGPARDDRALDRREIGRSGGGAMVVVEGRDREGEELDRAFGGMGLS